MLYYPTRTTGRAVIAEPVAHTSAPESTFAMTDLPGINKDIFRLQLLYSVADMVDIDSTSRMDRLKDFLQAVFTNQEAYAAHNVTGDTSGPRAVEGHYLGSQSEFIRTPENQLKEQVSQKI